MLLQKKNTDETKCFFRKMQIWFGLMVVAVFAAGEGELCNNG